jgi:hypothetical protein
VFVATEEGRGERLTKVERAVLSAMELSAKSSRRWNEKIAKARAELGDSCSHPPEARAKYEWEHDNGYGRQSWNTGNRCRLCDATDPYKRWDRQ